MKYVIDIDMISDTTKLLVTMAIINIAVGCVKVEDNILADSMNTYDSNTINFVTQTSKAMSNDITVMEGDTNGFVVYGLEIDSSDWYDGLDGNRYIYDSTSQYWGWASSVSPSWSDPFNQMNFYAYYPETASGFSLTATAPSSIIGDFEVEPSILDQTDYLASISGDVVAKPLTGLQSLSFGHIMSKVSFSVMHDEGVLIVIRQLGIENIINKGSYNYMKAEWEELSNSNIGSFDDYIGSSGVFAKYGVAEKVDPLRSDGHYLMLIPQSGGDGDDQTPLWDGSITLDSDGELIPEGAYISTRYRTSDDTEDLIGYAIRESSTNETEWDNSSRLYSSYKKGGSYTGPLFIKVGFKLTADQLDWIAGTEYDYTLQLNETGGIYLSEFYHDMDGNNTKIRVNGSPNVGDAVFRTEISFRITINDWGYSESTLHLK